ncbi:MAG: endonuclease domain-containing protein [Chloroflexi bacterium]|nr:endonuclease domain-containing protein [Chloroflexota bacterium]
MKEPRHRIRPSILAHAKELRHPQTPAEATLWQALRNRNFGYKFRRQHSIGPFIVDFYCAEVKLCIEVDGPSHFEDGQQEHDVSRTAYLKSLGCHMFRCTNDDVRDSINGVIAEIENTINDILSSKRTL